ncbi:glycosyltransferase [Desmonostoc muscorum LEGE 12446]|uniref:Glycosyltransferase n=1 Tax=Desmonostoc muscorum LEGE 12446 TaxID=1828758 RepID=A0A8J7DH79_DESMC|nr:glycosyltransferase family 4 protein [Desmonostoc muscorum]MCF2146235.1 glycosyltransferase [Desmonostoc muscorum LEGE 12446]
MKILLTQLISYIPTVTGANKANRLLIEELARNHACQVVAPAINNIQELNPKTKTQSREKLLKELETHNISITASYDAAEIYHHKGVEVHALMDNNQLFTYLKNQIKEFQPTWTLVATEGSLQGLLMAALKTSPNRVIYVVQTTIMLPFGPDSICPSPTLTEMLRQAAGIITISHYLKEYIWKWGKMKSEVVNLPVYGSGPFPYFGCFEQGYVTIVNPSVLKGISIFLELAKKLPNIPFAAVPGWGTTDADLAALKQLPNVKILSWVENIDEIFAQSRVLLVPSLWSEARGYVVTEAMLRGIPVLGSNVGGIPEAKLGIDYVLPVNQIQKYYEESPNKDTPLIPIVPPDQDIEPWYQALQKLLSDSDHYEQLSKASRIAALEYLDNCSIEYIEQYLETLSPNTTRKHDSSTQTYSLLELAENLPPQHRALLALGLMNKNKIASLMNGKQLAAAQQAGFETKESYVAPRTSIEMILAFLCADMLDLERVSIYDNLLDLLGNIITPNQFLSRVNEVFELEISRLVMFGVIVPNVAEIADVIVRYQIEKADPTVLAANLEQLKDLPNEEIEVLVANEIY